MHRRQRPYCWLYIQRASRRRDVSGAKDPREIQLDQLLKTRKHMRFLLDVASSTLNSLLLVSLLFLRHLTLSLPIYLLLHTILQIFLHQRFWTTINRFSLPSEYRQPMKSSICHTFIGFQRCTKIPINTDSLRVPRSVRPSLYPFYSPNCLHILSKVFRSTAKQPTPEVGSIRCGYSRIPKNY